MSLLAEIEVFPMGLIGDGVEFWAGDGCCSCGITVVSSGVGGTEEELTIGGNEVTIVGVVEVGVSIVLGDSSCLIATRCVERSWESVGDWEG